MLVRAREWSRIWARAALVTTQSECPARSGSRILGRTLLVAAPNPVQSSLSIWVQTPFIPSRRATVSSRATQAAVCRSAENVWRAPVMNSSRPTHNRRIICRLVMLMPIAPGAHDDIGWAAPATPRPARKNLRPLEVGAGRNPRLDGLILDIEPKHHFAATGHQRFHYLMLPVPVWLSTLPQLRWTVRF